MQCACANESDIGLLGRSRYVGMASVTLIFLTFIEEVSMMGERHIIRVRNCQWIHFF